MGAVTLFVALLTAAPADAARSDRCAATQTLVETTRVAVTLELTESSDIYRVCWRTTNRRRVVVRFADGQRQAIEFRVRGEWAVWRYTAAGVDRMGSIDARTGRRGPRVAVATSTAPFELMATGGPVARDVGDSSALGVYIASNGYYAWPVPGVLPDSQGGGPAAALYEADGHGGDRRIDVGSGVDALHDFRIHGRTLRWINHGMAKRAKLGPRPAGST